MVFWIVVGAGLVVFLTVVWWLGRGSRRDVALGADYDRIRAQATLQAQHTRQNIGDVWHG